jgi:F-type H+-transporting ATPase subunit delta
MALNFDTLTAAAGVYAEAVLELAAQSGQESAVSDELASLSDLVAKDRAFESFLSSPAVERESRRASLRKIFAGKLSDTTLNLLLVLNDKQRLAILPSIAEAFQRLLEARRGQQRMFVDSAVPLSDAQRNTLIGLLNTLTGRQPILVESVVPSVLGGLRVQVGDKVFDNTVYSRLRRLRTDLLAGVDAQLHQGRAFIREN